MIGVTKLILTIHFLVLSFMSFLVSPTLAKRIVTTTAFITPRYSRIHYQQQRCNISWLAFQNKEHDIGNLEGDSKVSYNQELLNQQQQQQQQVQRRPFTSTTDNWVVPKTIDIPEDRLEFQFVRSSGAGGQNVNKVNTKVEIRFAVMEAEWLPLEVRQRLQAQQANRINKDGILSISSQENRTQIQNRKAVVSKLQSMILEAYPRPKERKQRKGPSKAQKEQNKEFKRKRSQLKASRRQLDW